MKKNRIMFLLIFVAVISIIYGIILLTFNSNKTPAKNRPEAKNASKKVIDGEVSNVEQALNSQHIYKNYRIKSLRISGEEPHYSVVFMIDNISDKALEHERLSFTFIDSNKKYLSEVAIEIPSLQAGESQIVYYHGINKKAYDKAFDYKISSAKEASLPEK